VIGGSRQILRRNGTAFHPSRLGTGVVRSIQHCHGPVIDVIFIVIKAQNFHVRMIPGQCRTQVVGDKIGHVGGRVGTGFPGCGKFGFVLDRHSPECQLVLLLIGGNIFGKVERPGGGVLGVGADPVANAIGCGTAVHEIAVHGVFGIGPRGALHPGRG